MSSRTLSTCALIAVVLTGCSPNEAPVVTLEVAPAATGGPYYTDINLSISGTVADDKKEVSELTVVLNSSISGDLGWSLDVAADGTVTGSGPLSAGTHTLSLIATDHKDVQGLAAVEVVVGEPNSNPTCTITAPAALEVLDPTVAATLTASVDDVDVGGDALTVTFSSEPDGDLGLATPSGGVATTSATLSTGPHTLSVRAIDELGADCTDSVTVLVGLPPEIGFEDPNPDQFINDGDSLTMGVVVSDDFDRPGDLEVAFVSDVDGTLATVTPTSDGRASFQSDTLTVGVHQITATATDTHGLFQSVTAEVIVNGLPTAPIVTISPVDPVTTDDLVAEIVVDGIDPEGDDVSYGYSWTVDGVATDHTTNTVPGGDTLKNQRWEVTVTALDPYGIGDASSIATTVLNSLPEIIGVTLSPTVARVADTLTCSVDGATDADADLVTYTYAWTVDGTASATTADTLAGEFSKGETVFCTVTPNDGEDDGLDESSSGLVIANTAPTAPTILISPEEPIEGVDDLLCGIDTAATDVDGDSITYDIRWEVDGVDWTGSVSTDLNTGDTIDAGDITTDDEWECFATANDGTDDSAEASSGVVTVQPDQEIYLIPRSRLVNQGSTCSSVAFDSVYNGCSGSWGFSWTDVRTTAPSQVTVEMYGGVYCSSSTSKSPTLNGSGAGSFSFTGGNCNCNPSKTVKSWVLTSLTGYRSNSSNTFTIPGGGSCEGLSVNSAWGTGVYARVLVDY